MTGIQQFEQWSGSQIRWALDFLPSSTWSDIESPQWWASRWSPSPYKTVYSIPLIPATGGTLAEGASGAYNLHFTRLAQALVAGGEADAVLRLGWEFNGSWFRWSAAGNPAAFAAYWRQIVTTVRAVPGAAFKFDWCPVLGTGAVAPEQAYPGDAYVDYIGLDAYDQDWYPGWQDPVQRWQNLRTQTHGLNWHRDFAAAHGKPMTFPEWGLTVRPDGHGGGDDPYFIQKMHEWIAANNVAYALYFEFDAPDGNHRLMTGQFPQGAARFLELFGPQPQPPPPPPPPPPGPQPPPPPVSPPLNLERPQISGQAVKGRALIASTGLWSGSAPLTFAHRWESCDGAGSSCAPISGATAATYTPKQRDVGRSLRVVVTAANGAGTASASSLATRPVVRTAGASSMLQTMSLTRPYRVQLWRRARG